ncbi:MAG: hypothetical protein ACK4ND_19820 [Cytophagaceae bacterium]
MFVSLQTFLYNPDKEDYISVCGDTCRCLVRHQPRIGWLVVRSIPWSVAHRPAGEALSISLSAV